MCTVNQSHRGNRPTLRIVCSPITVHKAPRWMAAALLHHAVNSQKGHFQIWNCTFLRGSMTLFKEFSEEIKNIMYVILIFPAEMSSNLKIKRDHDTVPCFYLASCEIASSSDNSTGVCRKCRSQTSGSNWQHLLNFHRYGQQLVQQLHFQLGRQGVSTSSIKVLLLSECR